MNIALILSGGTGTRLGADIPKQYMEIDGRPVISYCMERLAGHQGIDAVQIVADRQWHGTILEWLEKYDCPGWGFERKFRGFSQPGENRQLSIFNGLKDICRYASQSDAVMIHDAARPLISAQLITDSLAAAEGHDGVLPVLSMKDTVYKSPDGKKISALLDRNELYAGQAQEASSRKDSFGQRLHGACRYGRDGYRHDSGGRKEFQDNHTGRHGAFS